MTFRIDPSRLAPADLPAGALDVVPHPPREAPSAPDPDAATLADSLRRFVSATRASSTAEIDAQRSDRIRAFFDRLDVEVPVLAGEPGQTRKVAVPFRMSHTFDNAYYNTALL